MQLTFRFHIEDETTAQWRRFSKDVEANAPAVPRRGEVVSIPGNGPDRALVARVFDVVHPLNGSVILDFMTPPWTETSKPGTYQADELLAEGFEEIAPQPNGPREFPPFAPEPDGGAGA